MLRLLLGLALLGAAAPADPAALRSRAVLHEIYDHEESWVKIHAAEALVAAGEAIEIRAKLLKLVPTVDSLVYRVGVWRVLAATSPTAADRAACVAAVEKIYLDPAAPDRSQAIETLCKLRVVVAGPVLAEVRREAALGPGQLQPRSLQPLALWSLALAGEPGALARLCAVLRSPDTSLRVDGAYALRLLGNQDPAVRRALAEAAAVEPPGTAARPYVLSAAFTLRADEGKLAPWRSDLEAMVQTGTSEARFEACQALRPSATLSDLARYEPLLAGPSPDTRIGAASTILHVLAHP
jgi:hypothetical protein